MGEIDSEFGKWIIIVIIIFVIIVAGRRGETEGCCDGISIRRMTTVFIIIFSRDVVDSV